MMISSNPVSSDQLGDWSSSPIASNSHNDTDQSHFVQQIHAHETPKKQKTGREQVGRKPGSSQQNKGTYQTTSLPPNRPSLISEPNKHSVKSKSIALLQACIRRFAVRQGSEGNAVGRTRFTKRKAKLSEDQAAARIQSWLRGILLKTFRVPVAYDKTTLLSLLTNALFDKQRSGPNDDEGQHKALAKANLAYTISTIEAEHTRNEEMLQRIENLRETKQSGAYGAASSKNEGASAGYRKEEGGHSKEMEFWSSNLKPKRINPELAPDVNTFNDISLQEANLIRHETRCRQKLEKNAKKMYFTYDGAATKIQSRYRGYIARTKTLPRNKSEKMERMSQIEVEKAAVKIQSR
eukprot:765359-Hanusia_phi.AAC.6